MFVKVQDPKIPLYWHRENELRREVPLVLPLYGASTTEEYINGTIIYDFVMS
jgi:hypothetical protein